MSEEILKALVQLFAIITKQDNGVTEKERQYVINIFTQKLNKDSVKDYVVLYDEAVGYGTDTIINRNDRSLSPEDYTKLLIICKKINEKLTQAQKIVVLQELLELVYSDKEYTVQRKNIIETVALNFNVNHSEFENIKKFILSEDGSDLNFETVLVIAQKNIVPNGLNKFIALEEHINGVYVVLRVVSVDIYLFRHFGQLSCSLNGSNVIPEDTVTLPKGSIIKTQSGATFFYSDIVSQFLSDVQKTKITFNALDVNFNFSNQNTGVVGINISEREGRLIGIMGPSGAGKTTLLNVLSGLEKPSTGYVKINGIEIYENKEAIDGVMGYVPQENLLIEDLTVFENLYYSAKLCLKEHNKDEIKEKVNKTLNDLGLFQIRNLKIGNSINKSISGGQRKRLNIALELIREPSVLFVDEPTSGLSSRDSENVIDLLKELSYKGKLIFVVIHQPSSDIYKMFDKIVLLDTGGYQIYYGNPIQAISYFQEVVQLSNEGFCLTCGNVNPEQMFTIIEEQVVDEFGQLTGDRKNTPLQWYESYRQFKKVTPLNDLFSVKIITPEKTTRLNQFRYFVTRDVKAKLNNLQYILVNLLEAPVLAFVLAFIIRYKNTGLESGYVYRNNDNIPAFIFMSIIVSLFMGLSVSAEEIIKDKKILKREELLNLSRLSYLSSKVLILFFISAIQTLTFVYVGNSILEIKGMFFPYWIMLFSASCAANLIGLNASSAFSSAITVYILIPILLIPQMILSGAMFNFDKINDLIKNKAKVPLLADLMVSRWAYEGLSVYQYSHNKYAERFYEFEKVEQVMLFNVVFGIPHMRTGLNTLHDKFVAKTISLEDIPQYYSPVLEFVLSNRDLLQLTDDDVFSMKKIFKEVKLSNIDQLQRHLLMLDERMNVIYNLTVEKEDKLVGAIDEKFGEGYALKLKDQFYNESLAEVVRNLNTLGKVTIYKNHLIPKTENIYFYPIYSDGHWDYRSHFFSPVKKIFRHYVPTFVFNLVVIWMMTILFFVILYLNGFSKLFNLFKQLINK